MSFHAWQALVPWVIANGYWLFLIAAIFEGPVVTTAAGAAAALGYYNVFIIMILAIAGDVGGDLFYYGLGRIGNHLVKLPFFNFLKLGPEKVAKIQKIMDAHTAKAVLLVKISPLIGPSGMVLMGAARAPFKKFFKAALLVGIPKSIFFVLIGFYSGRVFVSFNKLVAQPWLLALGIIIVLAIIYFIYTQVTTKAAEDLENN